MTVMFLSPGPVPLSMLEKKHSESVCETELGNLLSSLSNRDKKRGVFNIYLERMKKKKEESKRKQLLPDFKSLAADTDAVQADGGNFNLKGNSVTKTPCS